MSFLQRVKSDLSLPFLCLAGLYLAYATYSLVHISPEQTSADAIYVFGFWFIVSWWLWHDAKQNRFVLPMSYGFLILFVTPLYAPIYIFQTRGWMGFVTIGLYCFILFGISLLYLFAFILLQR